MSKSEQKNLIKEAVIEAVKEYPELYDKTNIDYKDRDHTVKVWKKIADETGLKGKFIFI